MMCFQVWDSPDGGSGGDDPNKTKTIDPKDLPKPPEEYTMEDIKGIMAEVAKTATKEEMLNLKQEIIDVQRKSVFPETDGAFGNGEAESVGGKSIVDTRMFSKSYSGHALKSDQIYSSVHPGLPAGMALGRELMANGGPFKRLSPEMETFAKVLKCRGNIQKAGNMGVDLKEHNATVADHLKQSGMNEGVVSQGGALVPVEYMATIIEFATAQSIILSKVWRMNMASNVLRIPKLVQAAGNYFGGITLYSPDEGELKEDTKPALERLEFTAKKLIGLIYLTDELIADSMINVINYVTGLFTRAFQYELERRVLRGTGVGGPILGIINDPAVNLVPRAVAGQISYSDIIDMDSAIDENFDDLVWMTRKAHQGALMKLTDTTNRPLFITKYDEFTNGSSAPSQMIGYPVFKTRNIPALGVKGDLVLGDLKWFLLTMRQDLTVDSSMHVRFIYDEECVRFVMRLDGMPAVSIAFAVLSDVES
jgi:HK97 family phage major capsid protein